MINERNEKEIRKVLKGNSIGYKWWQKGQNFALVNDVAIGQEGKTPRLFVFKDGTIPKESMDDIYKMDAKTTIRVDGKKSHNNHFYVSFPDGLHSDWTNLGSLDISKTQKKILHEIDSMIEGGKRRRPEEIIPEKITKMENVLRNMYSRGFFDSRTYNSLIGHTNPQNRFETEIRVSFHRGLYEIREMGNEFNSLEKTIKFKAGLEPDEKKDPEIKNDRVIFGKLTYGKKIGEEENIKIFKLTDEKFIEETKYTPSRMPNFNGDGTRLSYISRGDIEHVATVILYPDKFLASDAGRHPPSCEYGCSINDLERYKKEQKIHNYWKNW